MYTLQFIKVEINTLYVECWVFYTTDCQMIYDWLAFSLITTLVCVSNKTTLNDWYCYSVLVLNF